MKPDQRDWYEFLPPAPRYLGSCKARCASSGVRCQLPTHSDDVAHSSGRGKFWVTAAPGQTHFPLAELRDELATAQDVDVTTLIRGVAA